MKISRAWVRAAVTAAALGLALGARAAEPGDRLGAVVATRVDLQRQLGEWLTKSLAAPAEPYRVDAAVRLEIRGVFRELRAKQESATPAVKIGTGKGRVKLPGLGMVDGGQQGAPLLPEINIEGGTRVTEQVSRQLETEVVKLIVHLFVDAEMPKERRELLVRLASDFAGVDAARGDVVLVQDRPKSAGAPIAGAPIVSAGAAPATPKFTFEIVAICVTALLSAAILAFALSRRGGATLGAGGLLGRRSGAEGEARGISEGEESAQAVAEGERQRRRREEIGAFKVLVDATPKELVQIIAEADPDTAVAIVDLYGLPQEAAKLLDRSISAQRRIDIGLGLATAKVVSRDELSQMENVAAQALERVRSRVGLGGPGRLAEFLSQAPASIRQEVLDGVAARDASLAQAARAEMLLFEDLPRLTDAALRQVVAAVDPAIVALALVGAAAAREVVLGAVSQRLRSILEVEEETASGRPAEEIENARRAVEDEMRALQARGELRTRATATPIASATASAEPPPADDTAAA